MWKNKLKYYILFIVNNVLIKSWRKWKLPIVFIIFFTVDFLFFSFNNANSYPQKNTLKLWISVKILELKTIDISYELININRKLIIKALAIFNLQLLFFVSLYLLTIE